MQTAEFNQQTAMSVKSPRKLCLMIGAVALCTVLLVKQAPAQTNVVFDDLMGAADDMIYVAYYLGSGDETDAVAEINEVSTLLNQAQSALSTAGLSRVSLSLGEEAKVGAPARENSSRSAFNAEKLAKGINRLIATFARSKGKLRRCVTGFVGCKSIATVRTLYRSILTLGYTVGEPTLQEAKPKGSGMINGDTTVQLTYSVPPGCTAWTVDYYAAAGVVSSATYNPTTGSITCILGATAGLVTIEVTDCNGNTATMTLLNVGAKQKSSGKGPGGSGSSFAGTYSCTVNTWSPGGTTSGSSTFTVYADGNVSDATGAFTGTVEGNGNFTGSDNWGNGVVIQLTGTFYSNGQVSISGGDSTVGESITGSRE
jgi:hypothetical protein